jgi:hypothetical protein
MIMPPGNLNPLNAALSRFSFSLIRAQTAPTNNIIIEMVATTVINEAGHPVARMAYFDTYQTPGVVTEIMGITPQGWNAGAQMKKFK